MERQAYVRDEREGGSRDPGGPRSRERSGSQGHAPASVRGAGEDRRYRGSKKSARGREMGARKRERELEQDSTFSPCSHRRVRAWKGGHAG